MISNVLTMNQPFTLEHYIDSNGGHQLEKIKAFRDFLNEEFKNHKVSTHIGIFKFEIHCDNFTDAAKIETFLHTH